MEFGLLEKAIKGFLVTVRSLAKEDMVYYMIDIIR